MEPTGHYYKSLAYNFRKLGYTIALVNPYHTKLSKEIGTNDRSKNDVKDSRLIAKLTQEGKFSKGLLLTGKYAELRKLTLVRDKIVQENTRTIIRLRTLLDEHLPEYDTAFKHVECATSVMLLKLYGLKCLRLNRSCKKKIECILKASKGQIKREQAEIIVKKIANSIGVEHGIEAAQLELDFLLKQLASYREDLDQIEQIIREQLSSISEAKPFLEIKGIGPITTAIFLGQTGSFDQYTNAKQIEKLAGLAIAENQSGLFKGKTRINKRGRKTLRHVLHCISLGLITNNKGFKQYYMHKVQTLKKPSLVALISVQVKFLRIIFGLIKNNLQFDSTLIIKSIRQEIRVTS